jgi:hypothetical protein
MKSKMTGKQLLTFLRNHYNIKIFMRNPFTLKKPQGSSLAVKVPPFSLRAPVVVPAVVVEDQSREDEHHDADGAQRGQASQECRDERGLFHHVHNEYAHSWDDGRDDGEESEDLLDGHFLEHRSPPWFSWRKNSTRCPTARP